ncbi:F0F1 ATP synthase subunit I [Escherichia coli]|nr:F0F1 ATP synthase subunit I [Escherichia coli]
MSVSLVSRNVARKLLLVQLLVVIASGLLFSLKDPFWGVSAISGGLAVFLPNVLFMIFAWRHQAHTPAKGRVALDIRIWRSFQSSGDVGVTGGGVGGFKGGILAADRYVGFGAGGSDTGTGCN